MRAVWSREAELTALTERLLLGADGAGSGGFQLHNNTTFIRPFDAERQRVDRGQCPEFRPTCVYGAAQI